MEGLIARAAAGDTDALAELWRGHQHLLLRYFRGKGMSDPEDLTSIVWLEVAKGLASFSGGADDFRRWLFTIAARRRVDEIRRHQRRRDRDGKIAATRRDGAAGADDEYERAESLDRAIDLVRNLPGDQAEAVVLRVVVDMSVTDVAAVMDRSENNVRVLVHRGLKRLAEITASADADTNVVALADDGAAVTEIRARAMYAL